MNKYPINEETVRPYRLWDANAKAPVRWRYYANDRHAHWGALKETGWAEVGTSIEVYDAMTGRLLGQYTRRVDSVHVFKVKKFIAED